MSEYPTITLLIAACIVCPGAWADDAEVVALTGKGEYRPPASQHWTAARITQKLRDGGDARTAALSKMALLLPDETRITLQELTQLKLVRLRPERGEHAILRIERGKAASETKRSPAKLQMQSPHGTMSIRGTGWLVEVGEEQSEITVLSGAVEVSNDWGTLQVMPGEIATLQAGRAPGKHAVVNPAERVQWVSHFRLDAHAYPDLMAAASDSPLAPLREALLQSDLPRAQQLLDKLMLDTAPAALLDLLTADFALYRGDFRQAQIGLEAARRRHPTEHRLTQRWVEAALLNDQGKEASDVLLPALARYPQSAALWLAAGQLADWSGDSKQSDVAYRNAVRYDPSLLQAWQALGRHASIREDYHAGRGFFAEADRLALSAQSSAGLAWLEIEAGNMTAARRAIDAALTRDPADFQAWNAEGLWSLRQGNLAAALHALLKSSLIEPRFARTQLYLASVYFLDGREQRAREALRNAIRLDPHDPLPHIWLSLLAHHHYDFSTALDEAETAQKKWPYLKSLGDLAVDQRGNANPAYSYALAGMEEWARAVHRAGNMPSWAGSQFFTARLLPDGYRKQSSLLQGYLADPLSFGTAGKPRLSPMAGDFGSSSLQSVAELGQHLWQFRLGAYGLRQTPSPWAYFAEHQTSRLPRPADDLHGDVTSDTLALGWRASEVWQFFSHASHFEATIDQRNTALESREQKQTRATQWLVGGQWRSSPQDRLNFVLGGNQLDHAAQPDDIPLMQRQQDQRRHATIRLDVTDRQGGQWTTTLGWSRFQQALSLDDPHYRSSHHLRATQWQIGGEYRQLGPRMDGLLGLGVSHDRTHCDEWLYSRCLPEQTRGEQTKRTWQPRAAIAWHSEHGSHWRLAYLAHRRPWHDEDLAYVDLLGIAPDDTYLMAGGRQHQVRIEADTALDGQTFILAWADALRVENRLGQAPDVILASNSATLADLNRLAARDFFNLTSMERPEGSARIAGGTFYRTGIAVNQRLQSNATAYLRYRYTASEQTSPADQYNCAGYPAPWTPRHQFDVGTTFQPAAGWRMQATLTYRSARWQAGLSGCENNIAGDWTSGIQAEWQSPDHSLRLRTGIRDWHSGAAPLFFSLAEWLW